MSLPISNSSGPTAKSRERHDELKTGLRGFQGTAEQFFKGDLQALVAHYRASDDPVFRSDADSLSTLLNRQTALDKQFQAMQGPWYIRFLQVVLAADWCGHCPMCLKNQTGYCYEGMARNFGGLQGRKHLVPAAVDDRRGDDHALSRFGLLVAAWPGRRPAPVAVASNRRPAPPSPSRLRRGPAHVHAHAFSLAQLVA